MLIFAGELAACQRHPGVHWSGAGPVGLLATRSTDACDKDAREGHAPHRRRFDGSEKEIYPSACGTALYLALDRSKIQFAVSGALRGMAAP